MRTGAHLSSPRIDLGILEPLLRLGMRLGLRLRLCCAPAVVVRIPGEHGVKAEAACSPTQPLLLYAYPGGS